MHFISTHAHGTSLSHQIHVFAIIQKSRVSPVHWPAFAAGETERQYLPFAHSSNKPFSPCFTATIIIGSDPLGSKLFFFNKIGVKTCFWFSSRNERACNHFTFYISMDATYVRANQFYCFNVSAKRCVLCFQKWWNLHKTHKVILMAHSIALFPFTC